MTTETNSEIDSVKEAFAPGTEALPSFKIWKFRKLPVSS